MDCLTLEEQLESVCPSCGTGHDEKFGIEFLREIVYKVKICEICNYKIFLKSDIMLSASFIED